MKRDPLQCTRIASFRAATKDDGTGDGTRLRGYAAVFNQETVIDSWEGRFKERIDPGAFKKTLRESTPIMQWDHGMDPAVGRIPIGVYERLEADEHGLDVEGPFHTDPVSERVRQAIRSGAVTGMSFKFLVIRDEWRDGSGKLIKDKAKLYNLIYASMDDGTVEMPTRTIKEVRLFEAGPVSTPAYGGTSVGVRSSDLTESERMTVVSRMLRVSDDEGEDDMPTSDELREAVQAAVDAALDERAKAKSKNPFAKDDEDEDEDKPADKGKAKPADKDKTNPFAKDDEDEEEPVEDEEDDGKDKKKPAAKKKPVEKKSDSTATSVADAALAGTSARGTSDAAPAGTSGSTTHHNGKGKKMNLAELRSRRAAIEARQGAINTEFRDAALPEAVQTEFDDSIDELRSIDEQIARIEARQEYMRGVASQGDSRTEGGAGRSPAFHSKGDLFNLDELRMSSSSPEDFVSRATDNARKAIDGAHFARVTSKEKAQARAMELLDTYDDEDGTLAKRILATGSPVYERAFGKAMKACSTSGLTIEEQRAMSLGTDTAGGFAVPFQLDPTVILTNDGYIGDIRSVARTETIVGKEWQGVTSDGISVSRDNSPAAGELGRFTEATEAPDNSFTLAQPKIRVQRVQGFVPFSIEIEQDWGGLRSEITRMLADAKAREENNSFTNGVATDGVSVYPMGLVAGATNTISTGATNITPAALLDNLVALIFQTEEALPPRWRGNAKWMANKNFFNTVRQIDTTGGAALWEYLGNGLPKKLIGYDVVENSDMDSVVASKRIAAFGDFSQYLIVDRIGMSVELVPHIFGSNGRPTGQRGVYAIWRNNAMILVQKAIRVLTTPAA